jgi:hypothetical protein
VTQIRNYPLDQLPMRGVACCVPFQRCAVGITYCMAIPDVHHELRYYYPKKLQSDLPDYYTDPSLMNESS